MVYNIVLSWVAVLLGIAYIVSHGIVALCPDRSISALLKAPRSFPLGAVLMGLATAWFTGILLSIDLMEYTPHRAKFVIFVLALGGLSIYFLREFLTARALGALLLLFAQVLLDACFLRDDLARLVVTVTAYVYAVAGMFLVGMPCLLRDFLDFVLRDTKTARIAGWAGVSFGLALVFLGLFVY